MSEEHDDEAPDEEHEAAGDSLNTADPASVERASRRAKVWLAQRREFWRGTLSSEIGRKALWEFLTLECNFGNVPVANSPAGFPDPNGTMFWIGCKRVGDRLYDMLQRADLEGTYRMRVENDPDFSEARPHSRR